MDLLLDTSVFIQWDRGDSRIPAAWVETIVDPANTVYVSSATAWEVAIKRRTGKLAFTGSTLEAAEFHGFAWCEITARDAEEAGGLEWDHKDPFDRMLVAQAAQRGLTMVTTDAVMRRAPGSGCSRRPPSRPRAPSRSARSPHRARHPRAAAARRA